MPPTRRDRMIWGRWLFGALALLFLGSCGGGRLLGEDTYLVRKNRLRLVDGAEVDNWRAYSTELAAQLTPRPNGRFLFLFRRERFYLRQERRGDTSRFGGFVREVLAEEPAYLDTAEVAASAARVRTFLLNRGYFETSVRAEVDTVGPHGARVTYAIDPGPAYRYGAVDYEVPDTAIGAVIAAAPGARALRAGERVDARDYDREVSRLVTLLRNRGYADFYANSIAPLEADSAGTRVRATLRILPPAERPRHRTYTVGAVTVFPDVDPLATATTVTVDTTYDGLRVIYEEEDPRVGPGTIAENVFFRTGDTYDQSAIAKTNLLLNQLGVFRLVNIQQVPAADSSPVIDFLIQLTPAPRRAFNADPSLSFTDRQSVTGGQLSLIGLQAAASLADNNVAGGAERLTVTGDVGVEFNFARLGSEEIQRFNTFETGLTAALELPRFVDYFGAYRRLADRRPPRDTAAAPSPARASTFYGALRDRGTTQVSLSARYVDLLNFYRTSTLSGTFGYRLTRGRDRYSINHLGLEYFRLEPREQFAPILERSPFLQRSFGDQVFTALLLRNVSFARTAAPGPWAGQWTYLIDFEQAGAELLGVNALTNAVSGRAGAYVLGEGIQYARYGRLAVSVSQALPLGLRSAVAWRLASGAAVPFGYDRATTDVPYVRQFFGGGANSLRGWAPRAVGPGAYDDPAVGDDPEIDIPFQQADFHLETNLEFRSRLTRVAATQLDYAVFVDVGNIWTLRRDPSRPLSQLSVRERRTDAGELVTEPFWRQLAANTGFGFRWDLQFVLFRFDVGVKLRNPYPIDGTHWPRSFDEAYGSRFNIGIGLNYPF